MTNPTDPSIGWGSEFWLGTDATVATLTQLDQVFSMALPNDQFDLTETTHFKSPQKRKQYIQGLLDTADIAIEMNYEPNSDTDVLIRAARDAGTARSFKQVVLDGVGSKWAISGLCIVRGYERTTPIGDRKTATMTIKVTGAVTEAAGT